MSRSTWVVALVALAFGLMLGWFLEPAAAALLGERPVDVLLAVGPPLLGWLAWILEGAGRWIAATWALPAAGAALLAVFVLPFPANLLVHLAAFGVVVALVFSARLARAWRDAVLNVHSSLLRGRG